MGIAVLIVISSVAIAVQSKYYPNYSDQLARNFMHFGKRLPHIISQFDQSNPSLKRNEFSRDFMNFGKRSVDDSWPDAIMKIDNTPELIHKKSSNFDREFLNFGKRMSPFEQKPINSNKKSNADLNAFNRDFLSFGKRSGNYTNNYVN